MYVENESVFYYLTLYNEDYAMPAMPAGAAEGILKGMYKVSSRDVAKAKIRVQLLGSGPILRQVLYAQEILADEYKIASDVWSVTSYKELRREALEIERWNLLHPTEKPRASYVEKMLAACDGPFVAASDNIRLVAEQISKWVPGRLVTLGTDGFGRSDGREELRRHFEIDAPHIVFATLSTLARQGDIDKKTIQKAAKSLDIDPEAPDTVRT
jgi:pyruvate dehydrogenase E1 component